MNDDYKELYIDTYWKYYLKLENRLCKTEEFVAFDNANKKAFSIEYLSLLQIICSEVDVVAKTISAYYNKDFDFKDSSIIKWGYEIQNDLPGIMDQGVLFNNKEIIQPWRNWSLEERKDKNGKRYYGYSKGCGSPEWWKAYTDVKHARTAIKDSIVNYHRANQENVVYALAALYILHRLMLKRIDKDAYALIERSQLFAVPGWNDETRADHVIKPDGSVRIVYSRP